VSVNDGVSMEKISIFDTDLQSLTTSYPFFKTGAIVNLNITKKDPYYNAEKIIEENRDEFDIDEIAKKAVEDPLPFYNYILQEVDAASKERENGEYDPLSKLVRQIYSERKDDLLTGSSAIMCHHVGKGGNILHTAEVVNMCMCLLKSSIGKDLDKELLIAAAALHDVGKTTCYLTDEIGMATMTLEGLALGGHHMNSLLAIENAKKDGNYDKERILILENIIASHHGAREFGDIATPMTLEGYWLHAMDDLDAKHYEAREEIKSLEPGAYSAKKVYSLDSKLYRRTDQII
jgi:3'-5' exoribonuclease